MDRRQALRTIGAGAAAGMFAGCTGGGDGGGDGGDSLPQLDFTYSTTGITGLVMSVLLNEGFAQQNDLDLDVTTLAGVPALQRVLFAGERRLGPLPPVSIARQRVEQGTPVSLLRPWYTVHVSCVVREGLDINGVGDLRDVTIGSLPRGSSTYGVFSLIVAEEGYSIDDFTIQGTSQSAVFGLMQEGELDAGLIGDPFVSKLLTQGGYEELFHFGEKWRELTGASFALLEVFGYDDVINEKPDEIGKLNQALSDSMAYIQDNPDEVFDTHGSTLFNIQDSETLELAKERIVPTLTTEFSQELRDGSRFLVEKSIEHGLLSGAPPEDFWKNGTDL